MKILLNGLVICTLLFCSCGGGNAEKDSNIKEGDMNRKDPVYERGLSLVAKNKCLTCHAVDETITGPPYREIAKKYKDMPDTIVQHLAHKVITGGNGVWGQVFMIPHPNVSEEDAEAMVKYVLSLAK